MDELAACLSLFENFDGHHQGADLDEEIWGDRIGQLRERMDNSDEETFCNAVREKRFDAIVGLARVHAAMKGTQARVAALTILLEVCGLVPEGYIRLLRAPMISGVTDELKPTCFQQGVDEERRPNVITLFAYMELCAAAQQELQGMDSARSDLADEERILIRESVPQLLSDDVLQGLILMLDSSENRIVTTAVLALAYATDLDSASLKAPNVVTEKLRGTGAGAFVGETTMQLINRSSDDVQMQKLMKLILDERLSMLYASDVRVLVDICLRELGEGRIESVGMLLVQCVGSIVKREDYREEPYRNREIRDVLVGIAAGSRDEDKALRDAAEQILKTSLEILEC